ncbi:MAG: hypothetical protein WC325_05325 [Candidatus Bathyarchaeia archaeon]|jgi:uncharacterized protein YwgA
MRCFDNFRRGQKRERTTEERITDRMLLLYLIKDAGIGLGKTKLQKLAYLSELEMNVQGFKGLNFNFIKMPFGPFSSELEKELETMTESNILSGSGHKLTEVGKTILDNFQHIIESNPVLIEKIQRINREYAQIPRDELVDIVHKMCNPIRPWLTIEDTQHGSYLLKRMKIWHEDRVFKLSQSDIASLEIYFDPDALESLRSSLSEAKTKPAVAFNEVPDCV